MKHFLLLLSMHHCYQGLSFQFPNGDFETGFSNWGINNVISTNSAYLEINQPFEGNQSEPF